MFQAADESLVIDGVECWIRSDGFVVQPDPSSADDDEPADAFGPFVVEALKAALASNRAEPSGELADLALAEPPTTSRRSRRKRPGASRRTPRRS